MKEIFHRTSIRHFTSEEVKEEAVLQLLRGAMAAPSAGNQQPWEFYAITDRNVLRELAGCSPYAYCLAEAPLGIAICYRNNCSIPAYAEIDCSAATENLLLEADSLGLGAVWLGIAPIKERMEAVGKVLSLPDSLSIFALVACGHPAEFKSQEDRFDQTRIHWVK